MESQKADQHPGHRTHAGDPRYQRVAVAGATGYIGRSVVRALKGRGYTPIALVRESGARERPDAHVVDKALEGVARHEVELTDELDAARVVSGLNADAFVSCIASRSGLGPDAWLVDYRANLNFMQAAHNAASGRFVYLSAICVQRPRLEFQRAKLAFEKALSESGMAYTIVRPTAFFKSLAGQIHRVQSGKPFLVFGDGKQTACKPIGEDDLAAFVVDCLEQPQTRNCILPVGGPGAAVTPLDQGRMLFELAGRTPEFSHLPLAMLSVVSATLRPFGIFSRKLAEKAELAKIGHYYASESMLVWDDANGRYDSQKTPEYGEQSLWDFYKQSMEQGTVGQALGTQGFFKRGE